jgi:CRP/FNR family transcriptional regulator, cyclic AMP receptor protein
VLDGRLRLTASSLEGEEILFRWFMPGEFVGLSSAVGNLPFLVDARAVGDCRTANIGRSAFLQVLAGDAEAALSVARQVSQFAHAMTQLVIARSEHTLTARVYSVLQRLAKHNATERTNGEIALHFSQNDIAMAVGASRARVNLELHKLETMGRIHLRYKHIILLDAGRATGE